MTDPTLATLTPADTDTHTINEAIERGTATHERIPQRYRDAVADLPEVVNWVHRLVDIARAEGRTIPQIRSGPSLLLVGVTGCGKTYQAYGAVRALTVSGARCTWHALTAADLYARLRPRHGVDTEAVFGDVSNAGLLVVDDLGAAKPSEWNEEINYRLINYRYENQLPTLITSNVPAQELGSVLGDRVSSRLTEMAHRVVIRGADRRLATRIPA